MTTVGVESRTLNPLNTLRSAHPTPPDSVCLLYRVPEHGRYHRICRGDSGVMCNTAALVGDKINRTIFVFGGTSLKIRLVFYVTLISQNKCCFQKENNKAIQRRSKNYNTTSVLKSCASFYVRLRRSWSPCCAVGTGSRHWDIVNGGTH